MVILGGLEIVIGGYLVHRYHKSKNEKKRMEEEANQRRHHTFPGPKPQSQPYPSYPSYPQGQQMPQPQPQYKYACHAPQPVQQPRPYTAQPAQHAQYYDPQPQQYPQQQAQARPQFQPQIQPLRRQDSFATLSSMPIANGSIPEDLSPAIPPRQQAMPSQHDPQASLAPPANYPYYNTGFSASYPSFEPSSSGPMSQPRPQQAGTHTVDDNWETYGPQSPHVHFALPNSPRPVDREDDPPPPYRP